MLLRDATYPGVRNRYGHLNLRGVQRRERQALTLTLKDVYVSLQASVGGRRWSSASTIDMAKLLERQERPESEEQLVLVNGLLSSVGQDWVRRPSCTSSLRLWLKLY